MSFQIVSSPNVNITNAIALGVGYNSFDPIYITIDQAVENFKNLLLTRKGERLIHVTFGCDLTNIVFQPNVSELKEEIKNIITDYFKKEKSKVKKRYNQRASNSCLHRV